MISSRLMLGFGFIAALGMVAWGLSGVFTGRVLTKSYGKVDGKRTFYRFVRREEEPVWFWILCGIYTTVGIAMLALIYFLLHAPALSG
jgi:formate/nitrite transporter FocA (FNT family)